MKLSRDEELDLIQRLDHRHELVSRYFRDQFADLVLADRAELWREDGCRDMGEWLAGRFGISTWHARRWVAAAHKLEELPATARAFESGTLGIEKVVELTRYATPETEDELIEWATKVRPATIRHQADLATAPSLEEAQETDNARYLDWWWDLDGMSLGIEGRLPAHEGARFIKAVDAIAKDLPASPRPERHEVVALDYEEALELYGDSEPEPVAGPESSLAARRADALTMLAASRLASCDPDQATVVVHAELGALLRKEAGAEMEGGVVVPSEIARRLACDCRLELVATNTDGTTIGIARASRLVPRWLRRQMLHRDGGCCLFPGCGVKTFLHAHHIVFWQDGGATDLDNLATVCHFHHKIVHEFGWKVRLGPIPGTAEWFRPDGSLYEPGPVRRSADDRASPSQTLPIAI